jgi:hypothetical protein
MRAGVWGTHGVLGCWRSGRTWGSLLLKDRGLLLIRWRLIGGVERGESLRVRRVFRRRFGWLNS